MSNVIPVSEAEALREEVNQLRVQLAGCLAAAEGWGQQCVVGDYGWSPAYQAVIELRKLYEKSAQQSVQADGITICQNCGSRLRAGECENCNSPIAPSRR